jgi:hypothetical protein
MTLADISSSPNFSVALTTPKPIPQMTSNHHVNKSPKTTINKHQYHYKINRYTQQSGMR